MPLAGTAALAIPGTSPLAGTAALAVPGTSPLAGTAALAVPGASPLAGTAALAVPGTSPLAGTAALAIPSGTLLTGKLFQFPAQLGHSHGLGFLRGKGAVQSGDLHIHPVLAQGQPGFQSLVPFLKAGPLAPDVPAPCGFLFHLAEDALALGFISPGHSQGEGCLLYTSPSPRDCS